ncbi:unnamed protein product [Rhizoctonia solani]|uniref:Uncharacterized protein n=1 Tax=Rhizoctonia solani TaxID=456999 RepID=A0A8H3GS84_9AGAM|nr:unnamed protein product [Rhizoctonia solani]
MEQNAAFERLNPEYRGRPGASEQLQSKSVKIQEKPPRTHARTNSSSGSQAIGSRKRKADAATQSCHPSFSELSSNGLIVPVSMKRARVNAPAPPNARSCTRPGVAPKNSRGDWGIRKGIPGGPSGKYELDRSFGPSSRSHEKPTLYVTMLESGWFQAALMLPGFFECLIRPRANVNIAINGHLRFEWCGWNEQAGEIIHPSANNIGWLKICNTEGRIKGAIQTPLGSYLIQGRRVKSGSHIIQEKWEDYSGRTYGHGDG